MWLQILALAADLPAWMRTLSFDTHTPVRCWEPKRLRLRLLAVAGRNHPHRPQTTAALPRGWPWIPLIEAG